MWYGERLCNALTKFHLFIGHEVCSIRFLYSFLESCITQKAPIVRVNVLNSMCYYIGVFVCEDYNIAYSYIKKLLIVFAVFTNPVYVFL